MDNPRFKTFHTHGIFEHARSGGYRKQPSFQRWPEARADHLREQGIDVDLWIYTKAQKPSGRSLRGYFTKKCMRIESDCLAGMSSSQHMTPSRSFQSL